MRTFRIARIGSIYSDSGDWHVRPAKRLQTGRHCHVSCAGQRLARLPLRGPGFGDLLMQNGDDAIVHKVDHAPRARLHKMAATAGGWRQRAWCANLALCRHPSWLVQLLPRSFPNRFGRFCRFAHPVLGLALGPGRRERPYSAILLRLVRRGPSRG